MTKQRSRDEMAELLAYDNPNGKTLEQLAAAHPEAAGLQQLALLETATNNTPSMETEPVLPSELEGNPIAEQLLKQGTPVTRATYSTLAFGTSETIDLDPESVGMLNRLFPDEPQE